MAQGSGSVIRIAVCHHPVAGREQITDAAFLDRLRKANVNLLLHGHVHEQRTELIGYVHEKRIHVVGAGTFCAPVYSRPESTPRLYNLLEVSADRKTIRVHTRCLAKEGGAWQGWAVWPGSSPTERRTFYTISVESGS